MSELSLGATHNAARAGAQTDGGWLSIRDVVAVTESGAESSRPRQDGTGWGSVLGLLVTTDSLRALAQASFQRLVVTPRLVDQLVVGQPGVAIVHRRRSL